MSNKILAIDIHEDYISALLIKTGFKGMRKEGSVLVPLSDAPEESSRFEWGIQQVVESLNITGAVCLAAIPSGRVSCRNLTLPFSERRKIRQVLPFELEPLLPYEIDTLFFDFIPISKSKKTKVIAAAVENRTLDFFTSLFDKAGISPRIITGGGMAPAMYLAGKYQSPDDSFLYIDIDTSGATFFAIVSGKIHLIHHIRYSKDLAPEMVAERVSYYAGRIPAIFDTLYDFDFTPESIFILKSPLVSEHFMPSFRELTDLPVNPVDPSGELFADTDNESSVHGFSGEIAGPLCLAAAEISSMMPVNFSKQHYALSKYWGENKNQIITTSMLGVFLFILMMFSVVLDAHYLQDKIDLLDKQIVTIFHNALPESTKIVDPVQQLQVALAQIKEKAAYSDTSGNDVNNIDILRDMSSLIPGDIDVVLTRFVRGDKVVLIAGITDTFNGVDMLKSRLETSRFLSGITISSANMDKNINRVRFNLKADVVNPESGS